MTWVRQPGSDTYILYHSLCAYVLLYLLLVWSTLWRASRKRHAPLGTTSFSAWRAFHLPPTPLSPRRGYAGWGVNRGGIPSLFSARWLQERRPSYELHFDLCSRRWSTCTVQLQKRDNTSRNKQKPLKQKKSLHPSLCFCTDICCLDTWTTLRDKKNPVSCSR